MNRSKALYANLSPEEETTKAPERTWSQLSRSEKLSSVLYLNHVPASRRKEMQEIAKGENKRAPFSNAKTGARNA